MAVSAAFDGTNYMVGMETRGATGTGTQTAQFISQSGSSVGSLISTGRPGGMPAVGFNGTNYLMVWEDDQSGEATYGQIIDKSGNIVKASFAINTTTIGELNMWPGP